MHEHASQQRVEEWARTHRNTVRAFLFDMVRRADVAEDLTQEVFCRAWEARESYQEQGKGLAYLLKIADHLVCKWGRRRKPVVNLDHEGWKCHEPATPALTPARDGRNCGTGGPVGSGDGMPVAHPAAGAIAAVSWATEFCRDRRDYREPFEHHPEPLPSRPGGLAKVVRPGLVKSCGGRVMSLKKLSLTIFAGVVVAWWSSGTALADDASAKPVKPRSPRSTAASTAPKANPDTLPARARRWPLGTASRWRA